MKPTVQRRRKSKAKPKDIFSQDNVDIDVELKTSQKPTKMYDCRNVAFDTITYRQEVIGWVVTGIRENPDEGETPEFILKDPSMKMRRIDRGFFLILLDTDDNEYVIRDCDPLPTAQ